MKYTHTNLFLLGLFALLIFQACGEDDEPNDADLLRGTWVVQSSDLTGYSFNVSFLGSTLEIDQDNIRDFAFISGDMINSLEDSLRQATDELLPAGTTITLNDDDTYVLSNPNFPGNSDTWNLSADAKQLTLNVSQDNNTFPLMFLVEELSSQSLIISLTVDEEVLALVEDESEVDLTVQGITIQDPAVEYTFNFTRQ